MHGSQLVGGLKYTVGYTPLICKSVCKSVCKIVCLQKLSASLSDLGLASILLYCQFLSSCWFVYVYNVRHAYHFGCLNGLRNCWLEYPSLLSAYASAEISKSLVFCYLFARSLKEIVIDKGMSLKEIVCSNTQLRLLASSRRLRWVSASLPSQGLRCHAAPC